jgi:hypothetical protein
MFRCEEENGLVLTICGLMLPLMVSPRFFIGSFYGLDRMCIWNSYDSGNIFYAPNITGVACRICSSGRDGRRYGMHKPALRKQR